MRFLDLVLNWGFVNFIIDYIFDFIGIYDKVSNF